MQCLLPDDNIKQEPTPPFAAPVQALQHGAYTGTITDESMIVLSRNLQWYVLIGGRMFPMDDFQRGLLRKPSIEIKLRQPLLSQGGGFPGISCRSAETMLLLMQDVHMNWL